MVYVEQTLVYYQPVATKYNAPSEKLHKNLMSIVHPQLLCYVFYIGLHVNNLFLKIKKI